MVYVGKRTPALDAQFQAKAKASAKEAVPPQIKLGTLCQVIASGSPLGIGAMVKVLEYLAEHEGRKDVFRIENVSGEEYVIDRSKLGSTVDSRYEEQRARLDNFDGYRAMVEYYDSLSDKDKALLKLQGIC